MSAITFESRDVPGVGLVTATIKGRTRADGTPFSRMLHDARTEDGRPVANEDLAAVKAAFNAD